MKINIRLNKSSIDNAIQTLKNAQKQLQGEMLDAFYLRCYEFFVSQANYYLLSSGVGDLLIAEIQSSWHYEKVQNCFKIINNSEKAVYVEFGVGVVGGRDKHPNAQDTNYKYDVPSKSKQPDGSWMFRDYEEVLDIPQTAIISNDTLADGRMRIVTYGAKGTMYAFNALEDLRLEIPSIWEEIKIKYWG